MIELLIILALLCIVLLLSLCACQTTPSQAEVTEPTTAPTSAVPQGPAVFKFPENLQLGEQAGVIVIISMV